MALDNETLAAAKSYTKKTVVGGGAIKGKNCTIDSIVDIEGGHRITFKWTLDDGTVATCGWFDLSAMNIQNARLAGQKALELALAGTSTWTDPTWKYLNNVETSVNVTKIIGVKFQAKS